MNRSEQQSMPTKPGGESGPILGRINEYVLLEKLGGGGFGVVYRVRDTDTYSNVEYAIKTLHPHIKSKPEEMEKLRSKFEIVNKLRHPNIARPLALKRVKQVEKFNEDINIEVGDVVVKMDYAPGKSLSMWRKQYPKSIVPVDIAIDICKQIASALDYAHSEKIIHRDIKPGNIIIESRRVDNSLKHIAYILDFGLATEISALISKDSTDKYDTSGTRQYMAPEQWLGSEQGSKTDQYALACVFYELVSGAVPFAGTFETGDNEIMRRCVISKLPEKISGITEKQNQFLQKALSKKPDERFIDCSTFINALAGVTIDDPLPVKTEVLHKYICPKCLYENSSNSKFCNQCGEKILKNICPTCGAELQTNQNFCNQCGEKVSNITVEKKFDFEKEIKIAGIELIKIPEIQKDLYFGRYVVTQRQWVTIMGNNPSSFIKNLELPVESVSWDDCQKFIRKLNLLPEVKKQGIIFRLPSEEEWEHACRAGSTGKYGLLEDGREGTLDEMGWYYKNSREETHPVGMKKPNKWGLYDMHGNVREWTSSVVDEYRVFRGGCYKYEASKCEAGVRYWGRPNRKSNGIGFRLVAEKLNK